MKNKAVFFDRDGVVNKRLAGAYVTRPEDLIINPEIPEILSFLKKESYLLILITNQQGVGKQIMSISELDEVHKQMQNLLFEKSGINFDDIYFCTDLAELNSFHRKPNPGMLLDAIYKWNIEPDNSIMVGDSDSDVIAGEKAGLTTILINNELGSSKPDFHISNVNELQTILFQIIKK